MDNSASITIGFVLLALGLLSCEDSSIDPQSLKIYEGPTNIVINVNMVHSDSAVKRTEIKARKQLEFARGDLEFPEGIDIRFYTVDGELETTLRADRGYFIKSKNLYRGEGNVRIKNLIKDQSLQTEEIFWNQSGKKIYTDKFVTVQEQQTVFNGTGLEADDNFTDYQLKTITGRTVLPGE